MKEESNLEVYSSRKGIFACKKCGTFGVVPEKQMNTKKFIRKYFKCSKCSSVLSIVSVGHIIEVTYSNT